MALRGAFIGFGNVAESGHLPGWRTRSDVRIVAAVDAVPERRAAAAQALPEARIYADVTEMLGRERLDFVDICTPPAAHAAAIAAAQQAELHVLCEKPTVTRAAELAPLAAEARRRELALHTVHNWLKAPICRRITALVGAGTVGRVKTITWDTLRTQPAMAVPAGAAANWRLDPAVAGGGILVDHGWHALYCVQRWAGAPPQSIAARLETRKFTDWPLDDTASVTATFEGGATAAVFLTWTSEARANRIAITGDGGTLVVEDDTVVLENMAGRQAYPAPPALAQGSHHPDWFAGVTDDFVAAISAPERANLGEAQFCARAIELAQVSSAAGGTTVAFAPEGDAA
jgi:predicted dehydrogenase